VQAMWSRGTWRRDWCGGVTSGHLGVVQDAPAVLVVQLKRFEFSRRSRSKISKRVDFDTTLDLGPFLSKRCAPLECTRSSFPFPACGPCSLYCCLGTATAPKEPNPLETASSKDKVPKKGGAAPAGESLRGTSCSGCWYTTGTRCTRDTTSPSCAAPMACGTRWTTLPSRRYNPPPRCTISHTIMARRHTGFRSQAVCIPALPAFAGGQVCLPSLCSLSVFGIYASL